MSGLSEWQIARQSGYNEQAERERREAAVKRGIEEETGHDVGSDEDILTVDIPEKARLLAARAAVSRALDGDSSCIVLPPAEHPDSMTHTYDL